MQCSQLRVIPRRLLLGGLGSCQGHLEGSLRPRQLSTTPSLQRDSDGKAQEERHIDVEQLLSTPTWSVDSLIPSTDRKKAGSQVSSSQLRHLLKLSALPSPKDDHEEAKLLETLSAQLHFVREIQKVDTAGVAPFCGVRDETATGEQEAELGLAAMQDAVAKEETRGKHHRRIRRTRDGGSPEYRDWDVLRAAQKKSGRYFVVEVGKDG